MPYKDPADKRAYQRDKMRERRAGERGARGATRAVNVPSDAFTAKQAADVRDLLLEQVNLVRQDTEGSACERARCVAYIAGVLLRAIEAHEVLGRVEAVGVHGLRPRA